MTLLNSGALIEAGKTYIVSGWANVAEGGAPRDPIWDVVESHTKKQGTI